MSMRQNEVVIIGMKTMTSYENVQIISIVAAGAAGCSKEIPRSWNAKVTRRNMGGF